MPNHNKLSVRVRMYRQGLGDCFLLTFTRGQEIFNLLIDCGLFFLTKNGAKIMTQVAESLRDTTGKHLNAVALTHDHYDHTSGFDLAKKIFDEKEFKFDEVWVSWTEDKNHAKYKAIREHFSNILKGLRTALNAELQEADEKLRETVHSLVNDFFGVGASQVGAGEVAVDGTGFSRTWEYILKEKAGEVKCFRPGTFFDLDNLGVRIYVLGPPESFDLIEDEESPKDETYRPSLRIGLANSFLAAATGEDNSLFDAKSYRPFDEAYKIAKEDAEREPFFQENYGFAKTEHNSWRQIDDAWLATAGELALWMDDFTNNTCLALAIELIESKKVLIFPGDAQFGNWISWQKLSWDVPDGNGGTRKVTTADLFAQTVFYKVGHHGSHNATLRKSGLEMMNIPERELVAMIPTNRNFAKTKGNIEKGGWQMPEQKLLERLEVKAKGRIILADEVGETGDEKKFLQDRGSKFNLSPTQLNQFLENVTFDASSFVRNPDVSTTPEPLYVEYEIAG